MRSRASALAGSAVHLLIAPGTIVGLLPFLITRWRFGGDFGSSAAIRVAGVIAIAMGAAAVLECFIRFAWNGLGTPSPAAPTRRLVVGGQFRYVRNPIYVAAIVMIVGQAVWFGTFVLLVYAVIVWLGLHLLIIFYEEPTLRRQFPSEYADYARDVGRWIPRRRPIGPPPVA